MFKKSLVRITLDKPAEAEVRKWSRDDKNRAARIKRITKRVKSGGGLTIVKRG